MKTWREKLDPETRQYIENQLNEVFKHRKAYKLSSDPRTAQLWVAIANLSKQIFELELKARYIEKGLTGIMPPKKERPEEELKKIMKSISTLENIEKPKNKTKTKKK